MSDNPKTHTNYGLGLIIKGWNLMLKNLEIKMNSFLNNYPKAKKLIKRVYQLGMYSISSKIKCEGNIIRISPIDGMEYFFGYYDKSPWDATDRYILCLRVKSTLTSVAPKEPADIVLFDSWNNYTYKILGQTKAWNIQQGCMLQWLGPDFTSRIIYNDFRNGQLCAVILNIETNEEKIINMPIYSVDNSGNFAITLDFSRLHSMRKGYGYGNVPDKSKDEACPDQPCLWYVDLESNKITDLLKYTDFFNFQTRDDMNNAKHKVNHIMLNPSGNRFMVLHRWINGSKKYTRLVTINKNGTDLYNLNDDNMTSHCYWKNDTEIISYTRKKSEGNGYYLLKDKSHEFKKLWTGLLEVDGHPSYSPDGKKIVTDTYPDRSRVSTLYCIKDEEQINILARVHAPFKYDNDFRCDLHPRWNRSSNSICFDSVHEGRRGLYLVKVN